MVCIHAYVHIYILYLYIYTYTVYIYTVYICVCVCRWVCFSIFFVHLMLVPNVEHQGIAPCHVGR